MKQKLLFALTCLLLLVSMSMSAAKTMYQPASWTYNSSTQTYTESGVGEWKKSHSKESTNCILFWQTGFGTDPTSAPSLNGADMTFDPDAVLQVAETCYALNVNTLGFSCSNMLNKYKIIILMNYTDTWTCYGGGYDFECSALWLNPATVKPAGHSLAHEVGHSFHYMCYAAAANYSHTSSSTINTGFHLNCGNGQAIWEQTAQWQANQAYPAEMFGQSYPLFGNNANYAFSHEWMRYQSYWFHYYLSDYYSDKTIISQIWKQPMTGQSNGNATDFCQAYIALKGLTASQFYERYFDYALKCATYDFTEAVSYRDNYVGNFDYYCAQLGEKQYQVAYHSAPQSTGFNVIELTVPSSGTTITTAFKALTHGCALNAKDPGTYNNGVANASVSADVDNYNSAGTASYRGFRVGYVFLKSDGTRTYYNDGTVHCTGTAETTENISTTVPANTSRIFLVVAPALTTYVKHAWDEDISNDDQWPYSFTLTNTDIKSGTATIYTEDIPEEPAFTKQIDGRSIADVTLTYTVTLPPDASGYTGTGVTFNSGSAVNALCTAFQLESSEIFNTSKLVDYTASQSNNTIMSCALTSTGTIQTSAKNTNGTYGHWFNSSGTVQSWGSGCVAFTEINDTYTSATIGQYPGGTSNGTTRTIREGLIYKNSSGETAKATIVFNITFKTDATPTAYLTGIDYTEPTTSYTVAYTGRTVAQGAGFTVVSGANATKDSNTQLSTQDELSTSNIGSYITANAISGYKSSITVSGTTIQITYTSVLVSATSSRTYPTSTTNLSGSSTALTIEQGNSATHEVTVSAMKTALSNTSSTFETSFKTASNFSDYAALSSSMGTSKFYYYALNTAPTTSNFSYFATASDTIDTDMGSGVYTHYYLVTGTNTYGVLATANKDMASFKIGYDPTTAKFTIQVAEDCPTGTYSNVRLGVAVRKQSGGNKYYCGYYTFDITVTEPVITDMEETLNVERYPGQGYTAQQGSVDFTAAKTFLGVSEVTTDMLRIVNPDDTQISDYATYDGWFDADGVATTWGDNSKICVKFFQAISGGTYDICDMNGADAVGTTYTVKWALVNGNKTYTYNINVTFVERPAVEIDFDDLTQVGSDMVVNFTSSLGSSYEGLTSDVNVSSILSTLSVSSLDDLTIYAVQSDKSLDDNYKLGGTDGWRNADGDWQGWGDNACFCVKSDFSAESNQIQYVGGMDGKNTTTAVTYTATYAFVKNSSATHEAVILKVNLIYPAEAIVYNVEIHTQSKLTESLSIPLDDAAVTAFGLTWEEVKTKLNATNTANGGIGVANHTLAADEIMLYPATSDGTPVTTTGLTYNGIGQGHAYGFNAYTTASNLDQGAVAVALDWVGNRWVIHQKLDELGVDDVFDINEVLLYNDGTGTKSQLFQFHITVTEMPSITLKDTYTEYEQQSGFFNVTLERSLPTGKWLTFCAPFNIGAGEWADMGIERVMKLNGVEKSGESITLQFVDVTDGIWVGIPVIIKMAEARTGITMQETPYDPCTAIHRNEFTNGTVTAAIVSSYVKIDLPNDVYYLQDDKFRHTNYTGETKTAMKGWRAYFTVTDTGSEVKQLGFRLDDENVVPTDIEGMEVVVNDRVDVYTVAGTKVKSHVQRLNATEGLPAGIYLVGGKKVIVK